MDNLRISTSARDASTRPLTLTGVSIRTPAAGHPVVKLLDSLRIPYNKDYAGMLYVVDLKGLLALFECDGISVEEKNHSFLLREGNRRSKLSRNDLEIQTEVLSHGVKSRGHQAQTQRQ